MSKLSILISNIRKRESAKSQLLITICVKMYKTVNKVTNMFYLTSTIAITGKKYRIRQDRTTHSLALAKK